MNRYIVGHELIISFNNHNTVIPEEPEEEIVEYDGESYEKIGSKIEKYLSNTVLEGYGEFIARYSVKKGLNPYLIGAIIITNTNCSIQCNVIVEKCYNVGDLTTSGMGCFGGYYKKYSDMESGIKDLVEYIKNDFYENDLKTPAQIYRGYKKDSAWSFKVTRLMEKLKK